MVNFDVIDPVARLLETQLGVAHIDQLRAVGLSRDAISDKIGSQTWHRLGSRLVTTTPSLNEQQCEWAALAGAGQDAALAGLSAAAHHGLTGLNDATIHVLVPRGVRPPDPPVPVRLHKSRRYDPNTDLDPDMAMPMTRPARSLVDAATWSASARGACAVLAASVRQRICTVAELSTEISAHGPLRHRRIMMTLLRDIAGGPDALRSVDLPCLARRHGLPRPRRLTIRGDGNSRRRRFLEAEFTSRRGKSWLVQVDAAAQLIVGDYWSDGTAPHDLIMTDSSTLHFPAVDLYLNEIAVASWLHRILSD